MIDLIIETEKQMKILAAYLAQNSWMGASIFLKGTLGVGKTTFSRYFIQEAMQDHDLSVPSPTFNIVQIYEKDKVKIWHFDLYRIEDPQELQELGFEDIRNDGICLIEWPDRLQGLKVKDVLNITITTPESNPGQRHVTLHPEGGWRDVLTSSGFDSVRNTSFNTIKLS